MDDRFIERADVTLRPSFFYGRKSVTFYPGMVRLPEGSAPKLNNITHTITIDAEIPEGGAEGVLVCLGGDTGGWTVYMRDGKLVYHYNWFDMARYEVVSETDVPTGKVEMKVEFVNESEIPGGPASVTLLIDGATVGAGPIEKQVRARFSVESLDVGMDMLSPVDRAYKDKMPFPFTGAIEKVRFDFGDGVDLTPEEKLELKLKMD